MTSDVTELAIRQEKWFFLCLFSCGSASQLEYNRREATGCHKFLQIAEFWSDLCTVSKALFLCKTFSNNYHRKASPIQVDIWEAEVIYSCSFHARCLEEWLANICIWQRNVLSYISFTMAFSLSKYKLLFL